MTQTAAVPTPLDGITFRHIMENLMRDTGEPQTDALTGAIPTWRLDENPVYDETVRIMGLPGQDPSQAIPQAEAVEGVVLPPTRPLPVLDDDES